MRMHGKGVLGLEVPMPWCLCGNLVEEVGLTPVMYAKPISPVWMMNVKTYLAPTQKHKTEDKDRTANNLFCRLNKKCRQ